jgi:hypothetical protein
MILPCCNAGEQASADQRQQQRWQTSQHSASQGSCTKQAAAASLSGGFQLH